MDLPRVGALEAEVDARFGELSRAAAVFLAGSDALRPLLGAIDAAVKKAEAAGRTVELAVVVKEVDKSHEGLTVLSETVAGLEVDDPTVRTRILDAIGEVFSQLNRARAIVQQRAKELRGAEGRAEFGAQARLFAQAVQSALAVADSPERCDQALSRLLVQLEELEGRFGELDEFAADLAARREELNDAFGAKRQTLLDERQRRAGNLLAAAERILQGVQRRARTFTAPEELNAFFAGDTMVAKVRDLVGQLRELGDTVKADEVDGKLKAARQDGLRVLRDRSELFEGADNVIKFGRHRFFVNTQPLELTVVPRDGALAIHLTGTDFFERIDDAVLEASRDLWDQNLASECETVYRGEFLAYSVLRAAERGEGGRSVAQLRQDALAEGGLLATVRAWAAERHDEGYERGVHDVDAAHILDRVLTLLHTAGTLRHESAARALGVLYVAGLDAVGRELLARRARSAARLRAITGHGAARDELVTELQHGVSEAAKQWRLPESVGEVRRAARYLADELAADRPAFVYAGEAAALQADFVKELAEEGARAQFEDDLRALEKHPPERLALATRWLEGFAARGPHAASRAAFVREVAVALVVDRRVDRAPGAAVLEARVEGLLGQHARVHERALTVRLDEFLARLEAYAEERLPRWRAYRKARTDVAERERRRLRLDEFAPKVLSSFVRNRLVNEVYLPLVGANLAKQLGAAGDAKRTDLMGLLLLVSPPGYGKTTLMEYVASRLGLVFVKVNGPALGHDVVSIDPAEAPNATARQEVEKINLGLEMGNNVMLYLDDIQHTNPELLQKFISLCDGSRRIEGVWKGRTRTYDLRGKRFCIVMAGNPYTESGARFQIPDMLSNRADTYNLGDILGGREDAFALSYVENALTSNAVLAPLGGRDPQDLYKLLRIAQGEAVPSNEIAHPYSAAEVAEITSVLRHLLQVQRVLLAVNAEYIRSASQQDAYRTEPPFKLQGSYRNMNKIAEKVVAAIRPKRLRPSSTTTTPASRRPSPPARSRTSSSSPSCAVGCRPRSSRAVGGHQGVCRGRSRMGGKEDDPITRVTGTLSGLGEEIERVRGAITQASEHAAQRASEGADGVAARITPELVRLGNALERVARPQLEVAVQVPGPEASAEAIATRLRAMGEEVGPMLRATQHGLGTLPGLLQSLVAVLERMDSRFAQGVVPVAAEAMAAAPAAPAQGLPQALPYAPAPQVPAPSSQPPRPQSQRPPAPHPQHPQAQHPQAQHPQAQHPRHLQAQHPQAQHPQAQHPQAQHPQAPHPQAGAPAGGGRFPTPLPTPTASMPPAARPRFDVELGRTSDANLYLPPGMELDIVRDGGVFVPSRKALPLVGSSVILAVHVAGAPKFETTAVVTWRTEGQPEGPPAGFGARFPYLSGAQEALVRRYFAERPPIVLRSS
jgi:Tfp pilus assembly protein PilZ